MMEMASEFPMCEFVGVDIASLQPQSIVPRNCTFVSCNVLNGIPFDDGTFDYIHQRLLVTGIPVHAYDTLIRTYMRLLRPGGCIEICETDYNFLRTGPLGEMVNRWLLLLSRSVGIHLSFIRNMQEMLRDAGFCKVGRETISFPLGTWSDHKDNSDSDMEETGHPAYSNVSVGTMAITNAVEMIKALAGLIQEKLDVSEADIHDIISRWPKECQEYQTYLNLKVYYGCKPRQASNVIIA
jgi:ubiquinone/menaquinone biosynthesis C-methylase UbiE